MSQLIRIGEASRVLGVSPTTLRRMEEKNIITPIRYTEAGQRLYRYDDLIKLQQNSPQQSTDLSTDADQHVKNHPLDVFTAS